MKKTLSSLLALALATAAHAQQYAACVYQDGTLQGKYALAEKPVLAFSGNDIVLSVGGKLQIQFAALGTVVKFEEETSGIRGVSGGGKGSDATAAPVFGVSDGRLLVSGLSSGETVCLYTADGRLTSMSRAKADGTVSTALGKGVTVVRAGKFAFKVVNK